MAFTAGPPARLVLLSAEFDTFAFQHPPLDAGGSHDIGFQGIYSQPAEPTH